jgi:hypothetical protein
VKSVTKEEFEVFVKAYPRPLEFDVAAMFEPPLCTYNDFTLGDWPASVVASYEQFTSYEDPTPTGYKINEEANGLRSNE